MNVATWQSDTDSVTWAQQDSRFRSIVTVLTNERTRIFESLDYGSENRRLGRLEGYQIALQVLQELTTLPPTTKPPIDEPTYPTNNEPIIDYRD